MSKDRNNATKWQSVLVCLLEGTLTCDNLVLAYTICPGISFKYSAWFFVHCIYRFKSYKEITNNKRFKLMSTSIHRLVVVFSLHFSKVQELSFRDEIIIWKNLKRLIKLMVACTTNTIFVSLWQRVLIIDF